MISILMVRRDWLVALLRALRTALHTDAAARAMAAPSVGASLDCARDERFFV